MAEGKAALKSRFGPNHQSTRMSPGRLAIGTYAGTSLVEADLHDKLESSLSCRGVAQPGSAPALGAGGPRFKSARPDQTSHFVSWTDRSQQGRTAVHMSFRV